MWLIKSRKAEVRRLQAELTSFKTKERQMRRLVVALLALHPGSKMTLDADIFSDGIDREIGERIGGAGATTFFIGERK